MPTTCDTDTVSPPLAELITAIVEKKTITPMMSSRAASGISVFVTGPFV
ncbi:MAG: hypothetical protein SOZ62_01445 [Eubacteriales bacterium]|nr:hypothetical protein [Eubacteriales bacterium]